MTADTKWRAEAIFDALRAVGMRPTAAHETQDGLHVGIVFELSGNDTTPWHKAIFCDKTLASPKTIVMLWNDWCATKRKEMAINLPSETIQKAIQAYGLMAVVTALNPVKMP